MGILLTQNYQRGWVSSWEDPASWLGLPARQVEALHVDQGLAEQDVGRLDHGQTLGSRIKFDGSMDAGAAKT